MWWWRCFHKCTCNDSYFDAKMFSSSDYKGSVWRYDKRFWWPSRTSAMTITALMMTPRARLMTWTMFATWAVFAKQSRRWFLCHLLSNTSERDDDSGSFKFSWWRCHDDDDVLVTDDDDGGSDDDDDGDDVMMMWWWWKMTRVASIKCLSNRPELRFPTRSRSQITSEVMLKVVWEARMQ